ncbi:MAG: xanthine dehydrogenase family protein subunit M [Actinomycetota bacterium]|nr:xanthine dehydrogenase family protein subunit M [Actinomycetota bacterium]
MRQFSYEQPANTADALALADAPNTRYLGGGTNLVDLMKLGVEQPDLLVDVTSLLSRDITAQDGVLRIGAGASNSDLAVHPTVRQSFPLLSQALLAGASGQLRNVATVGGNLLQRTRCAYFQDVTKPCNKRQPGSACPARQGDHRNLAILGGSEHCIATHPSDMAVALAALGAVVHVETARGPQQIALTDLYTDPGDRPDRETVLAPGAIITAVQVPALSFGSVSRYVKVRERASYAFAIGSVAAALDIDGGIVRDVRLAFGAVAPKPWRASRAENALRGQEPSEQNLKAALAAELDQARPLRDNAYKVGLITTITVRVLSDLAGETER